MKKMLVAVGLVLAVAVTASAQTSTRNFAINIGAGLSLPIGDFGDFANLGVHGEGGLFWALQPRLEVGPAISYHHFGTEFDDSFGSFLAGGQVNYYLTEATEHTESGRPIVPFLTGGLGIAFSSFAGESDNDIFIGLGGGARMQQWYGKIQFVSIQTSGSSSSFFPITIGYRF